MGLHGSWPDVAIAGYSLGGGMGWLARRYGLQTNSVTATEIVLADGPSRTDATHEPDSSGRCAVATATSGLSPIEFAVYRLEELYAGRMFFPFERAGQVVHAWARMLHGLPDELMTWVPLIHFPDLAWVPGHARSGSYAVVYGAFLGDERDDRRLLQPIRDLGPTVDDFAIVPPAVLGDMATDPPDASRSISAIRCSSGLPA